MMEDRRKNIDYLYTFKKRVSIHQGSKTIKH